MVASQHANENTVTTVYGNIQDGTSQQVYNDEFGERSDNDTESTCSDSSVYSEESAVLSEGDVWESDVASSAVDDDEDETCSIASSLSDNEFFVSSQFQETRRADEPFEQLSSDMACNNS